MNDINMLGRPLRLGLISAGVPVNFQDRMRRACTVEIEQQPVSSADLGATSALQAADTQTTDWIGFNACMGERVVTGERYQQAIRWLLDTGVDAILCTCALQDEDMHIVGVNNRARALGISVIIADSANHVDKPLWAGDVIIASSDASLSSNEVVWDTDPERCRVGGLKNTNASAAGVVAGVALAELGRSLPRRELLHSLRAWALQAPSRMAS